MASVLRGSGDSSFGGNLSIEGVLTYEDVSSVDSVGIVTARSGLHVGTGASVFSPDTNELALGTNNTQRLTVSSGGDIGIGVDNPTYKVSVKDTKADGTGVQLHLWNNSTNNVGGNVWSGIRFTGSTADYETAEIKGWRSHPGTGLNSLSINTGGVERMVLSSSGVGIGTNSPEEILHVAAASETVNSRDGVLFQSTSSLAADTGLPLVFTSDIGSGYVNYGVASIAGRKENATTSDGAGYLQFSTGASNGVISEKMRIDSSGRLFVGTGDAPTTGGQAQFSRISCFGNTFDNAAAGFINIGRNQPASIMSSDDGVGALIFPDSSGGEFASIFCLADGTPGTGDYPGRLVFSVTADGASSPTEAWKINSQGSFIKNRSTSQEAIANNVTTTIMTVGAANAVVHFDVLFTDPNYRQGVWAGQFTLFVSDASGSPAVSYYLKEHWQDVGSSNWNSPVVTVAVDGSGNVTLNANNSNNDMNGNAYVYVTSITGGDPTITTYS